MRENLEGTIIFFPLSRREPTASRIAAGWRWSKVMYLPNDFSCNVFSVLRHISGHFPREYVHRGYGSFSMSPSGLAIRVEPPVGEIDGSGANEYAP